MAIARPANPAVAAARVVAPAAPARAADEKWDMLLVCIAGYFLASVGRVHELFPVLQILRPAVVGGLLAIGLSLFDGRPVRRWGRVIVPTTKLLLLFLAWIVLCIPFALWVANSVDLLVQGFIKTVLMYFVVAAAVRNVRDVERLSVVYFLAASLYAGMVIARFDIGAGAAWRLGRLYYYDANDFATYAVTAVPLGLYWLHSARRTASRLVGMLGLMVLVLGIVRAGSRGGFLALTAVIAFVLVRYTVIPLRWRLLSTSLILVLFFATTSRQFWHEMDAVVSGTDYNLKEETGRLEVWRRGLHYIADNPIFGVGANNFGMAEGTLSEFASRQQYGIGVRWTAAHNSYLQVAVELGIPGLVLFLALIVSALKVLRRPRRVGRAIPPAAGERPQLAQALMASLIGFLVGAFFLSLGYSEMFYMLVALAVGLWKVTAEDSRPAGVTPAPRR